MRAFFEIHDSWLREVVEAEGLVTLILDAIRIEWPTETMDVDGHVFMQRIQFDFEGTSLWRDSAMQPKALLDGSFAAGKHDAGPEDELDGYLIPVSLRHAEDVRLRLQGMAENDQDYVTLEITAKSMRVSELERPRYIQKIRAVSQENS